MSDLFQGTERLEEFAPLGYPMRKGDPEALAVPDYQRLRESIADLDGDGARAYLASFHPQNVGMLLLLLEWCLQLPQTLQDLADAATERTETAKAVAAFGRQVQQLREEHGEHDDVLRAIDAVVSLLVPDNLVPGAVDEFRAASNEEREHAGDRLLGQLNRHHAALAAALEGGDFNAAGERLEPYRRTAVTMHDALVLFTHEYPAQVARDCGEELAERLAGDSLTSCPGYLALWDFIEKMDAHELAAFLAEHLRFHFSGPGRRGSARIIEDDEKIRLVFDACGSGGALRRRMGDAVAKVERGSEATWGRSGEVPFYCTHCALNERISTERFGHPRMITEFDPDPSRPCGWTVYKNPEDIPDEVFRRIGAHRKRDRGA